jgi:hypothetical protein
MSILDGHETPYAALKVLQRAVREKLASLELELPLVPEPDLDEEPDDEGWLFDSNREYLEQLARYKAQGKE